MNEWRLVFQELRLWLCGELLFITIKVAPKNDEGLELIEVIAKWAQLGIERYNYGKTRTSKQESQKP